MLPPQPSLGQAALPPKNGPLVETGERVARPGEELSKIARREPIVALAWSPDSRWLAVGTESGLVLKWEVGTGSIHQELARLSGAVTSLQFRPGNGEQLVVGDSNDQAKILDLSSPGDGDKAREKALSGGRLAFSPDGKRLASASLRGGTLRIWEAENPSTDGLVIDAHSVPMTAIAWSSDARWIATAGNDRTIKVWNTKDRSNVTRFEGHRAPIYDLTWSPLDPALLASASADTTVRIWRIGSDQALNVFPDHRQAALRLAWNAAYDSLVSASKDETLRIWSLLEKGAVEVLELGDDVVLALALNHRGDLVATGSRKGELTIRHFATGLQVHTLTLQASPVVKLAASRDGTMLGEAAEHGSVRLWRLGPESENEAPYDLPMECRHCRVSALALDAGGTGLAMGFETGSVDIWRLAPDFGGFIRQPAPEKANGTVSSLEFHPRGEFLAIGDVNAKRIRIWPTAADGAANEQSDRETELAYRGMAGTSQALSFSPSGLRLASASYDRTIRVWDLVSASLVTSSPSLGGKLIDVEMQSEQEVLALRTDGALLRWSFGAQPEVVDSVAMHRRQRLATGALSFSDARDGLLATALIGEGLIRFQPRTADGRLGEVFRYSAGGGDGKWISCLSISELCFRYDDGDLLRRDINPSAGRARASVELTAPAEPIVLTAGETHSELVQVENTSQEQTVFWIRLQAQAAEESHVLLRPTPTLRRLRPGEKQELELKLASSGLLDGEQPNLEKLVVGVRAGLSAEIEPRAELEVSTAVPSLTWVRAKLGRPAPRGAGRLRVHLRNDGRAAARPTHLALSSPEENLEPWAVSGPIEIAPGTVEEVSFELGEIPAQAGRRLTHGRWTAVLIDSSHPPSRWTFSRITIDGPISRLWAMAPVAVVLAVALALVLRWRRKAAQAQAVDVWQWFGLPKKKNQNAPMTIVFTDLVRSTVISKRLGNMKWRALFSEIEKLTGQLALERRGHLVKSTGDGHLLAFRTVSQALEFACDLAELMEEKLMAKDKKKIRLRIGVHHGTVQLDDHDLHGSAVNLAAKIMQRAPGGSIRVTNSVKRGHDEVYGIDETGRVQSPYRWLDLPAEKIPGFDSPVAVWSLERKSKAAHA